MTYYNESSYENTLLELFQNNLGYEYLYGPELNRDYKDPLLRDILMASLQIINKGFPSAAIDEAIRKITNLEVGSLVQRNAMFTDFLQNGVQVSYLFDGKQESKVVNLVDYMHPENNTFTISNQFTVEGYKVKRPDLVLFVNGIPLVVIELKSPAREETDFSEAYSQLRNYMKDIPVIFDYNQICVISDMSTSLAGTITSREDQFMEWKTVDGQREDYRQANFDVFFEGIFEKTRLLNILQNFMLFSGNGTDAVKIIARYHQYFAVLKAVKSTLTASRSDGRGGVFWHTQGSGKSLSMVFYAHLIESKMHSPTIVVLTDRNDLDDQLYGTFAKCASFLRQTPIQAQSRMNLEELLRDRQVGGIIFSTMAKFEEHWGVLSSRKNIVVMVDEAHRSQYGLTERVVVRKGENGQVAAKTVVGAAKRIRDSLPNATYIGFTGTPISSADKDTRAVFGDYIDIYDMTQAVADHATRPVYYESRVVQLKLDDDVLKEIDEEYDLLADNADETTISKSKKELSRMESILGNDQTIDSLVKDIINHYENNRENLLTGKAMVVAYSRDIAVKIYKRMLELRPDWKSKVKIVMTGSNKDPEEWHSLTGNKAYREKLATEFKDDDSNFKIAIVRDMWLTGFDVPSLSTMYVYKPMKGHNLMQAIARVNRVFQDKEGGLVVDYIGIASALKRAMHDYTKSDQENYGDPNIATKAYPKFMDALDSCRSIFHGFDYSGFFHSSDLEKGKLIMGGVNYIIDITHQERDVPDHQRAQFVFTREAQILKQALSLCSSLVTQKDRMEAGYFVAVKTLLNRITEKGSGSRLSLKEINHQINELLKQSVKTEGVVSLFADKDVKFSLFDPDFLNEIKNMKEKNVSLELLKRLLNDEIKAYRRTNIVKSEEFSEKVKKSLNNYINGLITNEEVIEELMKFAEELKKAREAGKSLGLTIEELAFYDALCRPEAIRDFYDNKELVAIARNLTDTLRKSVSIDWRKKESARAGIRRAVKRLLRHYKYPPDALPDAVDMVLSQAELMADNLTAEDYVRPSTD